MALELISLSIFCMIILQNSADYSIKIASFKKKKYGNILFILYAFDEIIKRKLYTTITTL